MCIKYSFEEGWLFKMRCHVFFFF